MIQTPQYTICDVCRLLDFDTTPKLCGYCSMCDANICQEDMNKWGRRVKAFFKRKLEPGFRGLEDYDKYIKLEGDSEHSN